MTCEIGSAFRDRWYAKYILFTLSPPPQDETPHKLSSDPQILECIA
jgi:hypothetical protein